MPCLHSIRSIEMVKTDLWRILSFYALSKIHLDRHGSFRKNILIFSWDINLNPGRVRGIKNENLLHVLLFHDYSFSGDGFYNNLNSLKCDQEWLRCFKKRGMHFTHININIMLPKIDEVRYIANITIASIIGISETKVDKTVLSSQLQVDSYDLIRINRSRRGSGVACYIKTSIAYSYKDIFCSNNESIFVDIY